MVKKERASVTYRGTVGFSSPINMPKMMNSLEYAMYNNQQYDNGGASSGLQRIPDKTIEKIKGFMQNPYSARIPGIEANTSLVTIGQEPIIISMAILIGLIIILKISLSVILIT